jgi:hypothetical protein
MSPGELAELLVALAAGKTMHSSEFDHVDLYQLSDDLQHRLITLLTHIDVLADEAKFKSDQQSACHQIMFYRGVMLGLEIAHNKITRQLYQTVAGTVPKDN